MPVTPEQNLSPVSYDGKSFLIDGERVWLISGTLHPFRIPPEEWADRLDTCCDAHLNCIELYLPWNLLEPEPGIFDWSGINDYPRFLDLCRDRNLYVFLRPGPYICAEWDFGGLPAWLLEAGALLRSPDPRFMEPVARYVNEVFRVLGSFQRGVGPDGPIILIQAENEYWMSHPEGLRYLDEIRELMLQAGATVPLTDCNMLYNTPPTLHTINGGWNYPANFQRMRREFPDQPLFAAEFHCGWFTTTAKPRDTHHLDETDYFLNRLRYLSRGAMTNAYMFAGGTNFANWGARVAAGEFITASYDFSAPITEGGGRSDKYYFARLAHRLERLFAQDLAESERPCEAVYVHGHPHAITRQTPRGDLVFVFKTIDSPPEKETVPLIFGRWRHMKARFADHLHVRILPVGYHLTPELHIDFCEPQLFHTRETDTGYELFLYDLPGQSADLSINESTRTLTFPGTDESEPIHYEWGPGVRLWLFTHTQALRFAENDSQKGGILEAAPEAPQPIKATWTDWNAIGFHPDANAPSPEPIDDFAPLEALNAAYEQGIFSFEIQAESDETTHLYLRGLQDRAHVIVNGALCGLQGADQQASSNPTAINLQTGPNRIDLLVGNWGHDTACYQRADGKGFEGAPVLVRPLTPDWTEGEPLTLDRSDLDAWLASNMIQNAHIDFESTVDLYPLSTVLPSTEALHIAVPVQAAPFFVFLNQDLIHASTGRAWNTELTPDHGDVLAIAFTGPESVNAFDPTAVVLAADLRPLSPDALTFAPLGEPASTAQQPVQKQFPAWFQSTFTLQARPEGGVLIDLRAQSVGRLWLNGNLLTRYWHPGPQTLYWIPAGWLDPEENRITLFDEKGIAPPDTIPLVAQTHGSFQRYPSLVFGEPV